MKKKFLTILLFGIMLLGITGCSNPVNDAKEDLENAKQELEETYEKMGWVEKETVNTLIAKYNTEIMDSGLGTPASDDYMVIENGKYWFALTEEVIFYVTPVESTEDKMNDIAELSTIRMHKENYNEETIINYTKKLIKANNYELTDEEIDNLIKEAQELKSDKKMANNGKGISVGIYEDDDLYEYQVGRIYK